MYTNPETKVEDKEQNINLIPLSRRQVDELWMKCNNIYDFAKLIQDASKTVKS